MKATSSQLKSFLRTCKNAYVTIDLGNGPMMVKVIKSALSESISSPEYAESMWHYEFVQTDAGVDLKLGETVEVEEENLPFTSIDVMPDDDYGREDFSNSLNDDAEDSSMYHE